MMLVLKLKKRKFKIPEVQHTRWLQLREELCLRRRRAAAFVRTGPASSAAAPRAPAAAGGAQGAAVDDPPEDEGEAPPVAVDEETLARMRADLQQLQERKTELFTVLKEVLAQDERKRLHQAVETARARVEAQAAERRLQTDETRAAPAPAAGGPAARGAVHGIRGAMYQQHFPGGTHACAAASACCCAGAGDDGMGGRAGCGYGGGGAGCACQPHYRMGGPHGGLSARPRCGPGMSAVPMSPGAHLPPHQRLGPGGAAGGIGGAMCAGAMDSAPPQCARGQCPQPSAPQHAQLHAAQPPKPILSRGGSSSCAQLGLARQRSVQGGVGDYGGPPGGAPLRFGGAMPPGFGGGPCMGCAPLRSTSLGHGEMLMPPQGGCCGGGGGGGGYMMRGGGGPPGGCGGPAPGDFDHGSRFEPPRFAPTLMPAETWGGEHRLSERAERMERAGERERSDRFERSERSERSDRSGSERADRGDYGGWDERPERERSYERDFPPPREARGDLRADGREYRGDLYRSGGLDGPPRPGGCGGFAPYAGPAGPGGPLPPGVLGPGRGEFFGGGPGGRERMDMPPMGRAGACGDGAPQYRDARRGSGFSERPPTHAMGAGGAMAHGCCGGMSPMCGGPPPGCCGPPGGPAPRGQMLMPPDGRRQFPPAAGPHGKYY